MVRAPFPTVRAQVELNRSSKQWKSMEDRLLLSMREALHRRYTTVSQADALKLTEQIRAQCELIY
jgi:hypothetical protein